MRYLRLLPRAVHDAAQYDRHSALPQMCSTHNARTQQALALGHSKLSPANTHATAATNYHKHCPTRHFIAPRHTPLQPATAFANAATYVASYRPICGGMIPAYSQQNAGPVKTHPGPCTGPCTLRSQAPKELNSAWPDVAETWHGGG